VSARTRKPKRTVVHPRNKYGAKPTTVDGFRFASKAEARRYVVLRTLERGGVITHLRRQVRFPLHVQGQQIGHYVADFVYRAGGGEEVVEDVKGVETQLFRWKARHFLAEYGREILVTRA
jgi:hypothetical protein